MTAAAHVRRQAAASESFFTHVWRWIKVTIWRVLLRQSELERICTPAAGTVDEVQRTTRFRTSLALSGALVTTCNVVFDFDGFDTDVVAKGLIHDARINEDKLRALVESNHPTRWYPFSVTGINITGFIVDLIRERLLDVKLYRLAPLHANHRDETIASGTDGIHEVYCDIFTRFNKLWVDSNPRDVMAFPTIFQSLKDTIRSELLARSFEY
ncbi:hypothetical protein ATCC90586_000673 [Pythium insidiosum]|nr:hypothetical protein ATCC90586_000673 [Pythium insidiosum]